MEKSIEYLPYVDDDQVDEMIVQKKNSEKFFLEITKVLTVCCQNVYFVENFTKNGLFIYRFPQKKYYSKFTLHIRRYVCVISWCWFGCSQLSILRTFLKLYEKREEILCAFELGLSAICRDIEFEGLSDRSS